MSINKTLGLDPPCGYCGHPAKIHYTQSRRDGTPMSGCDVRIDSYQRFNIGDYDAFKEGGEVPCFRTEYCSCSGYTSKKYNRFKDFTNTELDHLVKGLQLQCGRPYDTIDLVAWDRMIRLIKEIDEQRFFNDSEYRHDNEKPIRSK